MCKLRIRKNRPSYSINDLKSVSSPEEIAYEIVSLALSVKGNGQQIAVSRIIPRGERFSKKGKGVTKCLEVQCKDHNLHFISHKNINRRAYLNRDCLHPNKKGQYMMGIFLFLSAIFTFESLYLQHQQVCLKIVFLIVRTQMK